MALADYYQRGALAAAQVIAGFDEVAFRQALEARPIGLSFDGATAESPQGQALLDLTVRLLARLYPALAIQATSDAEQLRGELLALAKSINPNLDVVDHAPTGIVVGQDAGRFDQSIFVGSTAWTASVSLQGAQLVGQEPVPFGAGAAACLAAATAFRWWLLDQTVEEQMNFSCLTGGAECAEPPVPSNGWALPEATVLVGLGAVGQAVVWTLGWAPLRGKLHLVDPETIELSNLQRYVLAARADETAIKVDLAASHLTGGLKPHPNVGPWAAFTHNHGYRWSMALTALDSAADRCAVQAGLPEGLINAWTQPGDLGVSDHSFLAGACLACLYLPDGVRPNEDEVVATALGVKDRLMEVRTLLHSGGPVPGQLLDAVAAALSVDREALAPFEGRPVRQLYVNGICGGAILSLVNVASPRRELHVPLAHQSALAGVLLAARLTQRLAGLTADSTEVTRINLLASANTGHTLSAAKDPRGTCICQDIDYQQAYREKWHH